MIKNRYITDTSTRRPPKFVTGPIKKYHQNNDIKVLDIGMTTFGGSPKS